MQKIKLNNTQNLIITVDNAGSIGEKANDQIHIDYESLAHFTLKNALMDNLSYNTKIISVVFANFCGESAYNQIYKGIEVLTQKLGYKVSISGSTESNFEISESAFSGTVVGNQEIKEKKYFKNYAVVGLPLVGNEVIENRSKLITLEEFIYLINHPDISRVSTVGSKGIYDRGIKKFNLHFKSNTVDVFKSAGPSTCVIIEFSTLINISDNIITKIYLLDH